MSFVFSHDMLVVSELRFSQNILNLFNLMDYAAKYLPLISQKLM